MSSHAVLGRGQMSEGANVRLPSFVVVKAGLCRTLKHV